MRNLGVKASGKPEKYLGLPMMVGWHKRKAFLQYTEQIRKRVECWNVRFLSMGGKEVFVKSVRQTIPVYAMQCFLFPKSVCDGVERTLNKFWWVNNKPLKGVHWSSWDQLC